VGPGTSYRVKVIADDWAGEVAQPFFDPPGGFYASPQSVSISCATEEATIRYTDDGSEPTETATPAGFVSAGLSTDRFLAFGAWALVAM